MTNHTMTHYLTEIKMLVDQIATAGASVNVEDIGLYTLNGLPSTYNSFKTTICTKLTLISLEDLCSLLIS